MSRFKRGTNHGRSPTHLAQADQHRQAPHAKAEEARGADQAPLVHGRRLLKPNHPARGASSKQGVGLRHSDSLSSEPGATCHSSARMRGSGKVMREHEGSTTGSCTAAAQTQLPCKGASMRGSGRVMRALVGSTRGATGSSDPTA